MKIIVMLMSVCGYLMVAPAAHGQLLNRIKQEVKNRAENRAVREAGDATDKAMDRAKEEVVGGKSDEGKDTAKSGDAGDMASTGAHTDYKSYDFVPGDKIIFEPDLSDEPDAELPARFIIKRGNAEIQTYESEKFLHLNAGGYVT